MTSRDTTLTGVHRETLLVVGSAADHRQFREVPDQGYLEESVWRVTGVGGEVGMGGVRYKVRLVWWSTRRVDEVPRQR